MHLMNYLYELSNCSTVNAVGSAGASLIKASKMFDDMDQSRGGEVPYEEGSGCGASILVNVTNEIITKSHIHIHHLTLIFVDSNVPGLECFRYDLIIVYQIGQMYSNITNRGICVGSF